MIESLKSHGIVNPHRVKNLMNKAISDIGLDLSGLTVLTEAASGNYVVTPLIAALARAKKVYAITRDSMYGKATEVEELTLKFARFCEIDDKIDVLFEKSPEIIHQADIVTNLGFVRPIDQDFISAMKNTAVITLMCEAWEFREGDIDLEACREKNILVMGTNENHPVLKVFDFCGNLCLKMLFELQIEIYKSKIIIVSSDKFGKVIEKTLRVNGAETYLVNELKTEPSRRCLTNADAVVIADYTSQDIFIGGNGHISAEDLFKISPGISVIQFAGTVNIEELQSVGIPCFPRHQVGSFRMGVTLAELGPKPVIDLHCAGLKVGEAMARARLNGKSVEEAKMIALKYSPAQDFGLEKDLI